MDTKQMIQVVVCYLELVGVLICVDAQTFSDTDGRPEGTLRMPNSPTGEWTAGTINWTGKDGNTFKPTKSTPHYPTDQSQAVAVWFWQPITWSWWVILRIIAALLGIVGNLLVIFLLFQRRGKSKSTDTLVGALAFADLFTSIFMIPHPYPDRVPSTIWGEIYCKLVYTSFFMWVSVVASIMTLTSIPVEQYIAVVYPFRSKEILSRKRVMIVVVLIWLVSFILHSVILLLNATPDASQQKCSLAFPSWTFQITIGVVIFVIEFLIPTLVTLTLQVLTARSLHHQSRLYLGADKRLDRSNPSTRHLIAKKRVLQTVFIVVLIFIVCWGPNQILFLAFNLRLLPASYVYSPLNRADTVLGFCNSCANPIIYTVRYPEFRKAMRDLFNSTKRNDSSLFGDSESKSAFPPTGDTEVGLV